MSRIVYEFNEIEDRVICLAPNDERLFKTFQGLSEALTLKWADQADLRLRSTRLSGSYLKSLLCLDLGQRSKMRSRVHILGVSLGLPEGESSPPSVYPMGPILQLASALIVDWSPGNTQDDAYLRLRRSSSPRFEKPCLCLIPTPSHKDPIEPELTGLRAQAQKSALESCFPIQMQVDSLDKFLDHGLEWILSF